MGFTRYTRNWSKFGSSNEKERVLKLIASISVSSAKFYDS